MVSCTSAVIARIAVTSVTNDPRTLHSVAPITTPIINELLFMASGPFRPHRGLDLRNNGNQKRPQRQDNSLNRPVSGQKRNHGSTERLEMSKRRNGTTTKSLKDQITKSRKHRKTQKRKDSKRGKANRQNNLKPE